MEKKVGLLETPLRFMSHEFMAGVNNDIISKMDYFKKNNIIIDGLAQDIIMNPGPKQSHCLPLCPSLLPHLHFPRPLQHYALPVHQMSPEFPIPDTPIFPAITSFPSPELSRPAPCLDLITFISHSLIHTPAQNLCSSVSSSMGTSNFP